MAIYTPNMMDLEYTMNGIAGLLALIFFIWLMYTVMKNVFSTIFGNFSSAVDNTASVTSTPFKFARRILTNKFADDGFMNKFEENKFLNHSHKGLVIDGDSKRLDEKSSFNHIALFARSGAGKTTSYIIPNIFRLAQSKASMVVTDLSGELFNKTSGYLQSRGYKIYVLNPEDLSESMRYNPMYYATDSIAIDEMAEALIKSSYSGDVRAEDKVWLDGAKSLMSIFAKTLLGTKDHRYINLANIRHLINHFGDMGKKLDYFVYKYADTKTFNEWKGFVSGNPKTVLSYVSTANMALAPIGINDNLEKLTSNHTIDFNNLRSEKSIVYIKVPAQKQLQYSFLLNIFYTQLFNTVMQRLPSSSDLPIYCLLDEFGNMNIPNFSSVVTTIRKYRVSISIVLQNESQMLSKYGEHEANTILNGGISGRVFFSGADQATLEKLEKLLGTKAYEEEVDGKVYKKEMPVMNIRELRTMRDNEILFIYANKRAMKLKTTPYYEHGAFKSYANMRVTDLKNININDTVDYVDCYIDIDFKTSGESE
jgi:type IV secretory pathway TraG/TraD family ATPase VirD4